MKRGDENERKRERERMCVRERERGRERERDRGRAGVLNSVKMARGSHVIQLYIQLMTN